MANTTYDRGADEEQGYKRPDLGPGHDQASGDSSDPRGEGPDRLDREELKDAENNNDDGGLYNSGGDKNEGDSRSSSSKKLKDNEQSADGGLFNNNGDKKGVLSSLASKKKQVALTVATIGTFGTIFTGLFLGISSLGLPNFMINAEEKGFGRFQVDTRGRSSKWFESYMMLRFGEVNDTTLKPQDRDNLYFRATKVDKNNPAFDWYRTMRASKFEQDLLESRGIKFTSVAERRGNQIVQRQALIKFDTGKEVKFHLSQAAFEAAANGEPSAFNGKLREFISSDTRFNNDKETRKAISSLLKEEYPGWWRGIKRWHIRHDIQNMIGVRKWTFFENKRQEVRENNLERRNKLIDKVATQVLPEDSKSGKFIQCLFGTVNCTASSDVANPDAQQHVPEGQKSQQDKVGDSDGDPKTPDASLGDGSGETTVNDSANAKASEGIRKTVLSKALKGANLISSIDALARFSQALKEHQLSKLITQIKGQYAVGAATAFAVAADQFKTGEMNGQEIGDFNSKYGNLMNGEGYSTVIEGQSSSSTVSAASSGSTLTPSKNKKEFCSEKHQEEMAKPENQQVAEQEYQWHCDKDKVGGTNNAKAVEDAWNSGPGAILDPFLSVFHAAAGGIVGVIDGITGFISNAAIQALGLGGTVDKVVAYGTEKAVEYSGANMDAASAPSGRMGNIIIEGEAKLGESAARYQGAASTTPQTAALATKNYLAYQQDRNRTSSFSERYLALSNPRSLVSRQAMSLNSLSLTNLASRSIRGLSSAMGNLPQTFTISAFAKTTTTNNDGYAAARFAGIETYDFPNECLSTPPLEMTPQNSTNADDMGLFAPDELTWELMVNKDSWYKAVYEKIGDKSDAEEIAQKVWNCALFDNTVRGGLGGNYGYKGEGAYGN